MRLAQQHVQLNLSSPLVTPRDPSWPLVTLSHRREWFTASRWGEHQTLRAANVKVGDQNAPWHWQSIYNVYNIQNPLQKTVSLHLWQCIKPPSKGEVSVCVCVFGMSVWLPYTELWIYIYTYICTYIYTYTIYTPASQLLRLTSLDSKPGNDCKAGVQPGRLAHMEFTSRKCRTSASRWILKDPSSMKMMHSINIPRPKLTPTQFQTPQFLEWPKRPKGQCFSISLCSSCLSDEATDPWCKYHVTKTS